MINKKHFTNYNNDIELIFVELNKFTKAENECNSIQDNWFYFLKNAGSLALVPKNLPTEAVSAYEVSNESGMPPEELALQYKKENSLQYSAVL